MPQTPVTDTIKINTTVLGAQFAPAIAVLSGGGYVIVWQDSNSGQIYAQRFNASGQPVGNELHLDNTQGGSALWVSVVATPADGFIIAFQAGFQNNAEIFARRYDGTDNPVGGLFAVNTSTPNEQCNPHAIALDNGGTLFTWDTRVTIGNDVVVQEIRGRIYDAAGQPIGASDFVIAPMAADARNSLNAITSLPGGGFVVTWQKGDGAGSNFEIVGQRYNASGGTVGTEFQINTQTANSQYGNDVARLTDGGFVVSWVDPLPNNGGGRIVARHYDANGDAVGGEILVDSKASGGYGRTVVTALADGGYVIGWIEDDGSNDNVLARAFGSNDQPLDAAFEMSFDSPFNGNFFSDGAVTLPNGNVVFAWDGPSITPPGGQGTGQDIYMRVYNNFTAAASGPTDGPDTIDGTAGDDTLLGLGGDDLLNGLAGNDILDGGTGADRMTGAADNDWYIVDNAGDVIVESAGQGNDRVFASTSYTLAAGVSVEKLTTSKNDGTAAINLTGNALANEIYGNDGNNILDGGGGADVLVGRLGDDWYRVDHVNDLILELTGEGNDRVLASVSYTLRGGVSVETLTTTSNSGTATIDLNGNELANALYGNAGNNILDGRGGADFMAGLLGNDWFVVDHAGDQIYELANEGSDRVFAGVSYTLAAGISVEKLTTASNNGMAAINLTGNEIANEVYGNNGANLLDGKGGNDFLVGLGGADTFQFTTALGAGNVDTVYDFVSGTDRIALDDAIFTQLGGLGALNANAFHTGSAAADANDRIVYNSTTGQLFYDADGNGAGAAVLFATLTGAPVLAASDFTVI